MAGPGVVRRPFCQEKSDVALNCGSRVVVNHALYLKRNGRLLHYLTFPAQVKAIRMSNLRNITEREFQEERLHSQVSNGITLLRAYHDKTTFLLLWRAKVHIYYRIVKRCQLVFLFAKLLFQLLHAELWIFLLNSAPLILQKFLD